MAQGRLAYTSTVQQLTERKNGASWRKLADELGYPASYATTLCAVAKNTPGTISKRGESELRKRLGLSGLERRRYHRPCMDDETYDRWLACKGRLEEFNRETGRYYEDGDA